ncbi:hypothetical protein ACEPAF_626 [Sanghuangporus sanghuang]
MSSFDKTVKLACKPKAAPPKAKYIDPIIAATYSEDGAVHDVCRALALRLREPNTIVVFKALIVLHTMIRNGATDNVLSALASDDILRLRSVTAGHWDGYDTPKNLQNYAIYLDTRIRTYKDLKHDPVRVQSDSNRDARVESAIGSTARASNGPQRSKTMMGRKLRSMTVEKGLLRETKVVQRTINALVECRFYFDNLEDDLNVTALRMLVKDLLILFQAVNEGVINVLEHYFEMSHVDAEAALNIYRSFCKQTEKVVEYLGVARKLQNLLNVPVPNLKHAPVSLVAALEEYLNDPNFEQNRIEYKTTKASADKNAREGTKAPNGTAKATPLPSLSNAEASSSTAKPPTENKALIDFFASIEEEQTAMFASQPTNQLLQQQQHAAHNPFAMRQSMMITGAFPQQSQAMPFVQPQVSQPTGLMPPQPTGMPNMAFQQPQPTGLNQGQHPSFSSFLRPQPTGFLQPQITGANPFRQSMLMPQSTGVPTFGLSFPPASNGNAFQQPGSPFSVPQSNGQIQQNMQNSSFGPTPMQNATSSPPSTVNTMNAQQLPQRPASTPLTNTNNVFEMSKPVAAHQTGSRNPFGSPQEPAPPVPKPPTLQELATGMFNKGPGLGAQQSIPSPTVQRGAVSSTSSVSQAPSSNSTDGMNMSGVASSFSFNKNWALDMNKPGTDTTGTPSLTSQFTSASAFSSQPTGTTNATSALSSSPPSRPQMTGFSGIRAFKPTSSFGASLLESLPPIPEPSTTPDKQLAQPTGTGFSAGGIGSASSPSQTTSSTINEPSFSALGSSTASNSNSTATPSFGGLSSTTTGLGNSSGLGTLNAQATGLGGLGGGGSTFGSSLGVGLRPQMTGSGVANPFRASMFNPTTTQLGGGMPPLPNSQFGSSLSPNSTNNTPSLGSNLFRGATGDASKRQNGVASLI